ncbi:MAG: PEP-CTERM sorting domain-containing protein [Rubrivivax sp.]|nr:MAG: PEP-CTERM sorting domain-containing protein [Rubrivivax sp.]
MLKDWECPMERTDASGNMSRRSAGNRQTNTGITDMNFKLTTLLATAAVAASLSSQAVAATVSTTADQIAHVGGVPIILNAGNAGNATLAYSQGSSFDGVDPNSLAGAVGAFNVVKLKVRGLQGATVDESSLPDPLSYGEMVRTRIVANLQVTGHTIDSVTGQILSIHSSSGIEHTGERITGALTGGTATVSNLRFDLASGLVYADLAGTKAAVPWPSPLEGPAVSYDLPNTALWTIGAIAGPTTIDPAALALTGQARIDAFTARGFTFDGTGRFSAQTILSDLRLTQAGLEFFNNSLGLRLTGKNAFEQANDWHGWGTATLNLSFDVPAVPEPGSYALAGVGLLVVWGARRRAPRKV